eukprot:CAMPEP_0206220084 /NCGR_PEP_ID=MMETSP0047_2-20121206/4690_1 /ASSEMBLY_ACC=CAM_ASM_000192 /TAXON_ID=195065 /ORGANISM="Chroomonas mesostigmatica_cf, Strain CCMP1168" /LENGTH=73 /DNA_ID=CAMNT_0053642723 /DNA_START=270 /DNA_END=491 /DNA_ORIENTATION=-
MAADPSLQIDPVQVERIAARVSAMLDLYSSNAQVFRACGIISRQMAAARAVIGRVGVLSLPWDGGWVLFQPSS